ncbi:hypothetical protein EF909_33075 [Streptomyces sp. WAC01280]|nr:hypothetical protein EF909_33075 [Streptomyces sp. WAC01280]
MIIKPNLAGKEHLAAIAGVLVLIGVQAWRERGRGKGGGPGQDGGVEPLPGTRSWKPPITS